jgi:FKBP-type peptidyl-prolyl cis-trans isomerase FklB
MNFPAPRSGRTSLLLTSAALAVLLAGATSAQTPPAGGASAPAAAPAAKPAAKPAGAKPAGAKAAAKGDSASYSVGVSMGEQLRASGITADMIDSAQLAAGVRDAVSGKASITDKDKDNIRNLVGSVGEANHRAAAKFLADNAKKPNVVTTQSGLQYKVLNAGSGSSPKTTDEVTVNYKGTLINGNEFDSSYKRGQPATFPVNRVIPGWTEALQLMKPGAKYQLWIPPQLAYDLRSQPGSMLIFEVELLSIKEGAPEPAAAQPAPVPTPAPKSDGATPK